MLSFALITCKQSTYKEFWLCWHGELSAHLACCNKLQHISPYKDHSQIVAETSKNQK